MAIDKHSWKYINNFIILVSKNYPLTQILIQWQRLAMWYIIGFLNVILLEHNKTLKHNKIKPNIGVKIIVLSKTNFGIGQQI